MDQFQDELQQIKEILKESGRGMSITEIARVLNKNNHSVGRYLDNLLVSGQVEMRTYGKAKVFSLSSRVPLDIMIEFAEDLIFVLDNDDRIVRVNNPVLAFFGRKRPEFLGKSIQFLTFSETWANSFFESIRSSLINGILDSEIQIPKKDGIVFRQKIIPTVFDDGKKGITILLEDITAKKIADLALRKSEEQFRLMAENIQDGIIIKQGNQGKTTCFINQRAEEIFGYTKEEFATINPIDLAAPEERNRMKQLLDDAKSAQVVPPCVTFWVLRKDGTRRYISTRITTGKQGNEIIYYMVITDITEWKHAQDALENQLDFLQHMINTFPNPLFYVDTNGRYMGCNSAFSSLLGKTFAEIFGKTNDELWDNENGRVFGQHNTDLITKPGVLKYTGTYHDSDQSVVRVTIQKSSLISRDNTLAGVVGLVISLKKLE